MGLCFLSENALFLLLSLNDMAGMSIIRLFNEFDNYFTRPDLHPNLRMG